MPALQNLLAALQLENAPMQALVLLLLVLAAGVFALWKSLYRAILVEVLRPMGAGLLVFVVIFVSNALLFNYMDFIINHKVPAPVVAKVMVYQLPSIAMLAVPVTFLLGVVLGLGRMGQDFELLAVRIGGVSFWRVCLPVYAAALVVSALVLVINQTLVPIGNRRSQDLLREYLFRSVVETREVEKVIQAPENRVFLLGRRGRDLLLFDGSTNESWPVIYSARQVRWQQGDWHLENGQVLKFDKHGRVAVAATVDTLSFNFEQPREQYGTSIISAEEKTIEELNGELKSQPPESLAARTTRTDIHAKLTLPLATLCFALIGTPLTIGSARIRYGAFLFSVLAAGLYYVGMGIMPPLSKAGAVSTWLANAPVALPVQAVEWTSRYQVPLVMWFPTAAFLLAGFWLTARLARK